MAVNTPGLTASLPNGYAVTLGIVNQLAVPYNPSRTGLLFYNDSALAAVAFCPASQTIVPSGAAPATPGQSGNFASTGPIQGVAVINGPGSITLAPGQSIVIDNLNCASAWNGVGGAAGSALTVLEF